jgi:hypothetical protein
LQGLNLTPVEYNKKIREWCKKHKFWGVVWTETYICRCVN